MEPAEKKVIIALVEYLQTLTEKGVEKASQCIPELPNAAEDEELALFYAYFGKVVEMIHGAYDYQKQIANGDLEAEAAKQNYLAMPIRSLQSSLKHLTWQASQVAEGDLQQQVYFLGEFSNSFNRMIESLKEKEAMQARLLQTQKMESVGQLAAGVAHEINTPAQFIRTNLDFVKDAFNDVAGFMHALQEVLPDIPDRTAALLKKKLEEADWEYLAEELPIALNQSTDGIDRVTSIIQAMKVFANPVRKDMAEGDVNELLQVTITVASSVWEPVAVMQTEFDPDLPLIPILADEMGQVILNLLTNAAYAIAEKQKETGTAAPGEIMISSKVVSDFCEVQICDTGTGMSEEVKQRMFEPFFTTKEVGKGIGQGLTTSYDIVVNKHNGVFECQTELGKGTCFTLRLPLCSEKQP